LIEVTKFVVRSFDLDHLDIFWEVVTSDEILSRFDFYVYRSVDGPGGPYHQLAGPLQNIYLLRDPDVHLLHKWRNYYYRLKIVNKDDGSERNFGPEWLREKPDRIALEIQRRHYLLLKEFNGRVALLYPALTFGQKCRHCVDVGPEGNTIGRGKMQNCGTCYDMRWVGGFASPIKIYIQIDPSSKSIQRTDPNERAKQDTTARVSAFPPIKPKDMIVEAENKRWHVERLTTTEKLRAIVHQELVLHRIPPGEIRSKVPIRLDISQDFSPEREYTRPMTLSPRAGNPVPNLLGEV